MSVHPTNLDNNGADQGPTVHAVGASGGRIFFPLIYYSSLFSLSLGDGSIQTGWLVVLGLMAL